MVKDDTNVIAMMSVNAKENERIFKYFYSLFVLGLILFSSELFLNMRYAVERLRCSFLSERLRTAVTVWNQGVESILLDFRTAFLSCTFHATSVGVFRGKYRSW